MLTREIVTIGKPWWGWHPQNDVLIKIPCKDIRSIICTFNTFVLVRELCLFRDINPIRIWNFKNALISHRMTQSIQVIKIIYQNWLYYPIGGKTFHFQVSSNTHKWTLCIEVQLPLKMCTLISFIKKNDIETCTFNQKVLRH